LGSADNIEGGGSDLEQFGGGSYGGHSFVVCFCSLHGMAFFFEIHAGPGVCFFIEDLDRWFLGF
jgi:hypothetical protein